MLLLSYAAAVSVKNSTHPALSWDSVDSSEFQPKGFPKHLCSQKMVGQVVIWLMWVPSGCPHVCIPVLTLLNSLASEQEGIACHGLCGRCVGVGCLARSCEGQWVVCAMVTDVRDCGDVNVSNVMFISQRKQPLCWCQKQLDLAHRVVCMSSC